MSTDIALTSLDIAGLVRNQHDNVMRTIRTLASSGAIQSPQIGEAEKTNHFGQRKEISHYVFAGKAGKRDSIVVVAELAHKFTGALIDHWQELEAKAEEPDRADCVMERVSILHGNQVMTSDISLRDYFAAAAMQGLLACIGTGTENPLAYFPKRSYQYADAMLAARGQQEYQNHEKETKS